MVLGFDSDFLTEKWKVWTLILFMHFIINTQIYYVFILERNGCFRSNL